MVWLHRGLPSDHFYTTTTIQLRCLEGGNKSTHKQMTEATPLGTKHLRLQRLTPFNITRKYSVVCCRWTQTVSLISTSVYYKKDLKTWVRYFYVSTNATIQHGIFSATQNLLFGGIFVDTRLDTSLNLVCQKCAHSWAALIRLTNITRSHMSEKLFLLMNCVLWILLRSLKLFLLIEN